MDGSDLWHTVYKMYFLTVSKQIGISGHYAFVIYMG
jgi:hypothetical protein